MHDHSTDLHPARPVAPLPARNRRRWRLLGAGRRRWRRRRRASSTLAIAAGRRAGAAPAGAAADGLSRRSRPTRRSRSTPRSRSPAPAGARRGRSRSARPPPRRAPTALECLTSAIYYEAGQESADGQRAVAQVILNRVRHPAFPASVCGVVYQGSTRQTGCQFTFTCDGSLARAPMRGEWDRARKVAAGGARRRGLCRRSATPPIITPITSCLTGPRRLAKTAVVGAHIFYRWSGGWGRPGGLRPALCRRARPIRRVLRSAALSVVRDPAVRTPATPAATHDRQGRAAVKVARPRRQARARAVHPAGARGGREGRSTTPYVERVARVGQSALDAGRRRPGRRAESAFGAATGGRRDTPAKAQLAERRSLASPRHGRMARVTGLEPATSGVTGRRSNQLSYTRNYRRGRATRSGPSVSCQRP